MGKINEFYKSFLKPDSIIESLFLILLILVFAILGGFFLWGYFKQLSG